MQTDKIRIHEKGIGRENALAETARFSEYMGLDPKSTRRVRLLVEEAVGMVDAITENFDADFWLEGTKDGMCRIHIALKTDMDITKKRELIDASKNKKNAAYGGFMGRIRELIEDSVYFNGDGTPREGWGVNGSCRQEYVMMGMTDMSMAPGAPMPMDNYIWSLENYRQGVEAAKENDDEAEAAWDELEKSIVANIADDVKVSVKGNTAELVVEKKFAAVNS